MSDMEEIGSAPSPEQPILRARARGQVSAETAFEQLYALYAPAVLGWLVLRADPADADDLLQDVWMIFYRRWQRWQFSPQMEAPEARPVLSFLFRSCHFVLRGHRRRLQTRSHQSLDAMEAADGFQGAKQLLWQVEFGRCLELARRLCPAEELEVLLAKLAGVPAREIARTLDTTEPAVDHRFRNAVARLKKNLQGGSRRRGRK
jgi:RNA polymerase sigma factor (sigma-70 family)